MNYTDSEVIQFVEEEDVKFIRLAFCDTQGKQKNISIMPGELHRAFEEGIAIEASAFGYDEKTGIILRPDPGTLALLPWRPDHGRVVRMYCFLTDTNGGHLDLDKRHILQKTKCKSGKYITGVDFYLFKVDETGEPIRDKYDEAGYMDIAPLDKGENIRRQICLTLETMGMNLQCSCHSFGPGQNRITFESQDVLEAADNLLTFATVARSICSINGLYVDFSDEPIPGCPKNICSVTVCGEKKCFSPDLNPYVTHLEFREDIAGGP